MTRRILITLMGFATHFEIDNHRVLIENTAGDGKLKFELHVHKTKNFGWFSPTILKLEEKF